MSTHGQQERESDATAALEPRAARDGARLLVQSPRRLYLYWSFAHDPRATLRRAFGELSDRFEIAARLVDQETGDAETIAAARGRSLWLDAAPGRAYRAEIGFAAEGLPFVRVLASNAVETPTDSISLKADDDETFRAGAQDFARLLAASGFAEQARAFAANAAARTSSDGMNAATFGEITANEDDVAAARTRMIAASSPSRAASSASFRVAPSSPPRVARRA